MAIVEPLVHALGIGTTAEETQEDAPAGLTSREERALVTKAKRGDSKAFEELINATSENVFSLLGRMVYDQSMVEDVAQNTYLRAWTGLREFKGNAKFSTWIYRIAVNEALTYIRRESRRRLWEPGGEELLSSLPSGKIHDGVIVDKLMVHQAMAKLPFVFRMAISLSYMEDLSYEEAALVMDVPLNTFRTYLHRGKIKLRKIIEGVEV